MQAPKSLRRPSNWQDFESLCKKLWGEIWSCPEISKNGRAGQNQHGVDVYGLPATETSYYGIQCKGKDEYTNKQFSEEEILKEIEKAKTFEPALRKLYFVTTAVKDADIEAFVRKRNLVHRELGLFEVHLYSWEDIVDLIDENPITHDWYVKNQNFRTNRSFEVTFQAGVKEIEIRPKFKQTGTRFISRETKEKFDKMMPTALFAQIQSINKMNTLFATAFKAPVYLMSEVNESFCPFSLAIVNSGTETIEDYQLKFSLHGNVTEVKYSNVKESALTIISMHQSKNLSFSIDTMSGVLIPPKSTLVGDESLNSSMIFLKPLPEEGIITLKWKLISRNFKDNGELKIFVKPIIETDFKTEIVEDETKAGLLKEEITDYISRKEGKSKYDE